MVSRQSMVDVLVAGAGPVGLTAALQLARCGVSVRIVDSKPAAATSSRALSTHARTMEIYDQMGILGDIAPYGTRVNAFIRHGPAGASRVDYDFRDLATPFPYMFMLDQVVTEGALRGHAAAVGVDVEWSTALETFAMDDDGVTVTVRHRDGSREQVRAAYLWGCDGGHSTVRKQLDLPLQGRSTHTWLVADAVIDADLDRDGLHWLYPTSGAVLLFPFPNPGKWRLLDTIDTTDMEHPDLLAQRFTTKLSQALGRPTQVHRPTWASAFTIQQRAVPRMRVGRCVVSGDAAHVHSPASGQGMNTGIQDAYNLSWKLAMVLSGQAKPELLDSYDTERVPVGKALLTSTAEVMSAVISPHPTAADTDADHTFMRQLIRSMSGLEISYPDSLLTLTGHDGHRKPTAGPLPGQRLTQIDVAAALTGGWASLRAHLRHPGWHLLVFTGAGAAADEKARFSAELTATRRPEWLHPLLVSTSRHGGEPSVGSLTDTTGQVHSTLAATAGCWMLVRPDGYLSARGNQFTGRVVADLVRQLPLND